VTDSRLVTRNVSAGHGRRTSMRLELEFWDALHEICQRERRDLSQLVRVIEAADHSVGRTSAVRSFVVKYFHAAAPETSEAIDRERPQRPPRHAGHQASATNIVQTTPPPPHDMEKWPAEQIRRLTELWLDPTITLAAIAREFGVHRSNVILRAAYLGLPGRPVRHRGAGFTVPKMPARA
jgi:predicted DNA-binding ribbon-helix-helix protein